MTDRSMLRMLMVIGLTALCLRVGAIVLLESWAHPNPMEHRSIARALLAGDGFAFGKFGYYGSSSVQSPTYPLLLAGAFWLFGEESHVAYASVLLFNAVLGAAVAMVGYPLARALGGSRTAGLLAAALIAVWPTQIYLVTHAQAIAWITLAIAGLIVLFNRAITSQRWMPAAGFAVVLALGLVTEPVLLPSIPVTLGLWLLWPRLGMHVRLRNVAMMVLALAIIVGPWTVRNRVVHGKWIPVKSTFWANTWKGNNPNATGTDRVALTEQQKEQLRAAASPVERARLSHDSAFDQLHQFDLLSPEQMTEIQGRPEAEREAVFARWTKTWIRENPGRYVELAGIRLLKTVWLEWDNPRSYNPVYMISRTLLVLVSLLGLLVALRRPRQLVYPVLLYGSCVLIFTLTIAAARFGLTFEPVQLALSAMALAGLIAAWRRDRDLVAAEGVAP